MTYALCGEEKNLRKYAIYDRKVQRSTVVIVVTNNASNNITHHVHYPLHYKDLRIYGVLVCTGCMITCS